MSQRPQTITDKIVGFFDDNICDMMQLFILGDTNTRRAREESSYVMYIKNILSLAFIFAHGCLKNDINNEGISDTVASQGALRIINSLNKAYSQYPVTPELVQFVLADIQFEMLRDDDSELYEVFKRLSHFPAEFNLTKYFKLIAEWRTTGSARFNTTGEVAQLLLDMLKHMEFLSEYDLVQDEEGRFSFVAKTETDTDYDTIPVYYHLYYNDDESLDMFALFSIEKVESNTDGVKLRYICERTSQTISFTATNDSAYSDDEVLNRDPEEVFSEVSLEPWEGDDSASKKKQ